LYREGKNRAVHSLPTAFIELCEESERSCHGLWSLSNVYELYRRTVTVHARRNSLIVNSFSRWHKKYCAEIHERPAPRQLQCQEKDINCETVLILARTANTDGIIHKLVTVFADHCFLPGYCPPLYPDTLSCMSYSSATGINFCFLLRFVSPALLHCSRPDL
jgi:hypothetical protein